MKSRFGKVSLNYVIFIFAFLFGIGILGCTNDGNPTDKTKNKFPTIISDSFFWGTWVRMDNGEEYEILESNIIRNYTSFTITDSSIDSLSVSGLGTFKKESDSVIVCESIPYFRKGGANLEYSLKLVGFTTSETISSNKSIVSRAAGTNVSGIKGKGKSKKYKNFESNSESNEDGTITFTAPTANDPQTVELITDDDEIVIITGLEVSNDGDNMGTVALVGKDDYNLKITGKISDNQKDGGYLFGNNAKTYEMEISITNVSENKCSSSGCTIKSADEKLSINSSVNLEGFPITTLVPHATKTISVELTYGELSEPYVDTGLIITIENPLTNQTWEDYIPLRFFKGTIPITIAAKNPENNNNAALNGFVIYPDGNNQFFAIKHNDCKPIFVPTFGSEKPYKLVFSGATVTAQLSDSTEMFYTVEPASLTPRTVVTDGMDAIRTYIPFGGNNHSENNAYSVTEGFEAYLNEGEIDYYSINAYSDEFYGPGGSLFYSVSYINEKGDAPESFLTVEGATLNSRQLPEMECEGYEFLGWYDGDRKVEINSYRVQNNIKITAKWKLRNYRITYNLNGGIAATDWPSSYNIENTEFQLPISSRTGYDFDGWYLESDFEGNKIVSIPTGTIGNLILKAKWNLISYKINYELDNGMNNIANPISYTIEDNTINLAEPRKEGYVFAGWYSTSLKNGTKQTSIEKGTYGDITLYAKWLKECTIKYSTPYGIAPVSIKIIEGNVITAEQLPELIDDYHTFEGWYIGDSRISESSYIVTDDLILSAKWKDKDIVSMEFISYEVSEYDGSVMRKGDKINLDICIHNKGSKLAKLVDVSISTEYPHIKFLKNNAAYGDIEAGCFKSSFQANSNQNNAGCYDPSEVKYNLNSYQYTPFVIEIVSEFARWFTTIPIQIVISDESGNKWIESFDLNI